MSAYFKSDLGQTGIGGGGTFQWGTYCRTARQRRFFKNISHLKRRISKKTGHIYLLDSFITLHSFFISSSKYVK